MLPKIDNATRALQRRSGTVERIVEGLKLGGKSFLACFTSACQY